jgi:hypothetical protein
MIELWRRRIRSQPGKGDSHKTPGNLSAVLLGRIERHLKERGKMSQSPGRERLRRRLADCIAEETGSIESQVWRPANQGKEAGEIRMPAAFRMWPGAVEGFSKQGKSTAEKANGFRTCEAIEIDLDHQPENGQEPEFPHRFW